MPFYYHYTSRNYAQNIICSGQLIPGPSGNVYLSPDLYVIGQIAADDLSISGKPVEMGVMILDINHPSLSYPTLPPFRRVPPLPGPGGSIIRRGGGLEIVLPGPIGIQECQWISLKEP